MKKILIKLIKLYKRIPGPWHSSCRYIPTCSDYAIEAIDTYGSFKGGWAMAFEFKIENEEALFHIYNMYRDEGGNILFTAEKAPARLNFRLPDLRSRMNIVPAVEIKEPDDDLLSALLVKLFVDRQIMPSPEIINYMLANMSRSFDFARKLVAEVDNISLERKRAISIPIVKEALSVLNSEPKQGDLFS